MELAFAISKLVIAPRRQQGVTLLELIVTIGVIGVILSIALPALRGVRVAALEGAELAHQRDVGNVVFQYTADHHGRFPYFGVPETDQAPLEWGGGVVFPSGVSSYWNQPWLWHLHAMNEGYDEAAMTMTGPVRGYQFDPIHANISVSPYASDALDILTHTAFARPSFWREESAQSVQDHHPQPIQSVAHPSAKGILLRWNWARGENPGPIESHNVNASALLWFADGHGANHRMAELTPGVPMHGLLVGDPIPVLMTKDGVLGRDVGRE